MLQLLRLLRLIKLLRIVRSTRILARFEERYSINYAHLNIYRYLTVQLAICHWMACLWVAVVS